MENKKYVHTTQIHNMTAPRIVVEKCLTFFKPKSVIDFGCGLGTFLKAFKEQKIEDVLGFDGAWVNKTLLKDYLNDNEFIVMDLEQRIQLNKRYDLALSLEVAEHLKESVADIFVENLISASDVILFSAAIPFQGGQNHINEQWPNYWVEKFKMHGYSFVDVMRERLWDEELVNWWYKQNIFFIVKETLLDGKEFKESDLVLNKIHPDHYLEKVKAYNTFRLGKGRPKAYFKLFIKSVLYKLNLLK